MRKKIKFLVIASFVVALAACKSSKESTNAVSAKSKPQEVSQLFNQMDNPVLNKIQT